MVFGLLAAVPGLLAATPADASSPPQLDDADVSRSTNGAMLLSWDAGIGVGAREYELQEADDPSFETTRVRYRGSFSSWFMSGRLDGTHYFRVRSRTWPANHTDANHTDANYTGEDQPPAWSEWSATKVVIVEHHPLDLALLLFGFGAVVFFATGFTLIHGAREGSRVR